MRDIWKEMGKWYSGIPGGVAVKRDAVTPLEF